MDNLIAMILCYLAGSAVVAVTWGAGAHLFQLPNLGACVTAALPVGADLGLALTGLLHRLEYSCIVDSCSLTHLCRNFVS